MGKFESSVMGSAHRHKLISVNAAAMYPKTLKEMPIIKIFQARNKTSMPIKDCPYIAATIK